MLGSSSCRSRLSTKWLPYAPSRPSVYTCQTMTATSRTTRDHDQNESSTPFPLDALEAMLAGSIIRGCWLRVGGECSRQRANVRESHNLNRSPRQFWGTVTIDMAIPHTPSPRVRVNLSYFYHACYLTWFLPCELVVGVPSWCVVYA